MKKTLLSLLLLLPVLFWLPGCDKDPDPKSPQTEEEKLPPPTQEGKMTFGCLVDGMAWIPKGSLLDPGIQPSYNEITGLWGIYAKKYLSVGLQSVLVSGEGLQILSLGTYSLTVHESMYSDTTTICPGSPSGLKKYKSINGVLEITRLDISTGIVSGLFNFDVYSPECQDTVKITKGRFDIKYK
mgnify:CR=1 FL=1|jgi:hypothetical protein